MVRVLSNPHTHTTHVDGKSTAREQVERAIELGFVSLGFSEHAAQAQDPDCGMDDTEDYRREILALREEYRGRLRIWLGVERDRLTADTRTDWDYFIGANHYFVGENGGIVSVDGNAERLEQFVAGDWDGAIKRYFEEYTAFIEAVKPDIIAHFDLITKRNHIKHWFSETDGVLIEYGKQAMERMIQVCDVLEVNTGGMPRAGRPYPYPTLPLLKYWHDLGGRVIPSSDCHLALQLNAEFDTAVDYMRAAGFTSALRLGTGDELFESYAL